MENQNIKPTGCCDIFNPDSWRDKEIKWGNKLFVKDHIASFLHIPLNTSNIITKDMALIEKAGAKTSPQLMLTDEKSMWGADIYIDVIKGVAGATMATLSGTFLTKVFEGPYQNAGKWAMEMKNYVKDKDKAIKKLYFFYTTCPKCAKAYGKNYVVLFAKID
ncbi:MAG: hydrolase [Minisyncoccales bacterium]